MLVLLSHPFITVEEIIEFDPAWTDHAIHSIMHCDKNECIPFTDVKKVYDSFEVTCI